MATQSSGITALYEDVVSSLLPFYDNYVLLPTPGVLSTVFNINGSLSDAVKVPITNYWTAAASSIAEGANIINASAQDFGPTSVRLVVGKRGAGTYVTEEALEDGGLATVRSAVLTRLSRSIAQATDLAGFNVLASGAEATLTDIANVSLEKIYAGGSAAGLANCDVSFVMSPDAMAYAIKREPTVKMFNDVNFDRYEMVASVRNGFARIPYSTSGGNVFFAKAVIGSDQITESNATLRVGLDNISEAVAKLRKDNAPTDASGFYMAVVSAAHEFHLARELNNVGATNTGAIGALSDAGNQALLDGLIGQAVGCRFVRSNNVPTGLLSA